MFHLRLSADRMSTHDTAGIEQLQVCFLARDLVSRYLMLIGACICLAVGPQSAGFTQSPYVIGGKKWNDGFGGQSVSVSLALYDKVLTSTNDRAQEAPRQGLAQPWQQVLHQ
jgi:hypothetical protein